MKQLRPTIADYMTPGPHSVEAHEPLTRARGIMRELGIRHLPVMRKGKLVGALSERDANLVEGLAYAPADAITVEDAMTSRPYVVTPAASLHEVARMMIERKLGSAVVVDDGSLVGVFTTSDALRALLDALRMSALHDVSPGLGSLRARDLMSRNPMCCTPGTPLEEVARIMEESECAEVPVVDDLVSRHPVGVVSAQDICRRTVARGKNPLTLTAGDCMSSPCVTVEEDDSVGASLALLEQHRIARVPVVDSSGAVCGIIALEDFARRAA